MNSEFITIDNNYELNKKIDLILKKLENIEQNQKKIENKINLLDNLLNKIDDFIKNQLYKFKMFSIFPNLYNNVYY